MVLTEGRNGSDERENGSNGWNVSGGYFLKRVVPFLIRND